MSRTQIKREQTFRRIPSYSNLNSSNAYYLSNIKIVITVKIQW